MPVKAAKASTPTNELAAPLDAILVGAPKIPTPRFVRNGFLALVAALAFFWIVAQSTYRASQSTVGAIGHDTAPSVVTAQMIRASLADLAANAANALLVNGANADQAWADYDKDQAALADELVSAAQNITFGQAERGPLLVIQRALQTYEGLIGEARIISNKLPPDQAQPLALDRFRRANALVDSTLAPAARALNDANEVVLDNVWSKHSVVESLGALVLAAAPAILVLIYLSRALSRRTRRTFNAGLVGAFILLIVGVLVCGGFFLAANTDLRRAKTEAFDSVRALWNARAGAYIANGAESFYLLDPTQSETQTKIFFDRAADLMGPDVSSTAARAALLKSVAQFGERQCSGQSGFKGLLGEELNNIVFDGECQGAILTYRSFAAYLNVDAQIRALQSNGQHSAAVDLCIGRKPGQSNAVFDQFDNALSNLIDINQKQFTANIAAAESALAPLPYLFTIVTLLSAALAYFGLRRIGDEYRT